MPLEQFRQILDAVKKHGDYLYFHVKGEPLLHPELGAFLDLSNEKGFKVNITTNGTRLAAVKEVLLHKVAIRQMNISLQSFEFQEEKDQENYMQQVMAFVLEAKAQTDMYIELRLWNLEEDGVSEAGAQRNSRLLKTIENALDLSFELQEEICKGKGVKIAERIYLSQSYEFEWPELNKDVISTDGFCYGLRNQLAILVDGTVIPCCLDSEGQINLGNFFEVEKLDEIIDGARAQALLNGFSNREVVEPLCQRCGYRKRFD